MAISQMIGAKIHRREDPRLITGNGRFVEDLIRPGRVVHGRRAQSAPARAHHAHQHHAGAGDARRRGRADGSRLQAAAEGHAPRGAGLRGRKAHRPRALSDRGRRGVLPGRAGRRRGRRQPQDRHRRRAGGRGRVRAAAAGHGHAAGARAVEPQGPRRPGRQPGVGARVHGRRQGPGGVRPRRRRRQRAHPAAAPGARPRSRHAACRPNTARFDDQLDHLVGDAESALHPPVRLGRAGHGRDARCASSHTTLAAGSAARCVRTRRTTSSPPAPSCSNGQCAGPRRAPRAC